MAGTNFGIELFVIVGLALMGMLGCGRSQPSAVGRIDLASPVFVNGQTLPKKYTADGENISPPLKWSGVPEGARELVLIMDDPDAPGGTWDHWLLMGIPAGTSELKEGLSAHRKRVAPAGLREGRNSWGNVGYEGPEPPPGGPHSYVFKLYALDAPLSLPAGADKAGVLRAMKGHVLAEGQLTGKYGR
jgi:hypothetical protein